MRLKLAVSAVRALKNFQREIFRVDTADANNRDTAFTGRRGDGGDGIFLVHKIAIILTAPKAKATFDFIA